MSKKKTTDNNEAKTVANDETTCLTVEEERNGEPIQWSYWATRQDISSRKAAKLTHLINPIKWPVDNTYAKGPIPDDLSQKIQYLYEKLKERKQSWTIIDLVENLGADFAPYGMKKVIPEAMLAIEAKQAEEKREVGRFTLKEAAKLISANTNESKKTILGKLMKAAKNGFLWVYRPGENAIHEYGPESVVLDFYEEAFWCDLNKWLKENEPRIDYQFPKPHYENSCGNLKKIITSTNSESEASIRFFIKEPTRKDDWFNCIKGHALSFHSMYKKMPAEAQLWAMLFDSSQRGWSLKIDSRKEQVFLAGKPLDREAFKKRFRAYFSADSSG